MTYDDLRHFADSWGLLAMTVLFIGLIAWPFRKGARQHNHDAANMIFREDDNVWADSTHRARPSQRAR
jgi:cytochrome c oxidase cbb3-type subunit 4